MAMTAEDVRQNQPSVTNDIKVKIKKDILKNLIKKVERSVEKKGTVQVKKGIFLSITSEALTARALNSTFGTEVTIPHDDDSNPYTIEEGEQATIIVMDPKFPSFVSNLPNEYARIKIQDDQMSLTSGRARYPKIATLDGSEFPAFPQPDEEATSLRIPVDVLHTMYKKTAYATSPSESRPALTGVNHAIKDGILRMTATDAHRLAQSRFEIENNEAEAQIIVPSQGLSEAQKHLADTDGFLTVHLLDNQVMYDMGHVRLFTRTIDANFPDTTKLIPSGYSTRVEFRVGDIKDMIKRALLIDSMQDAKWKLKPEARQSRLSMRDPEMSSYYEDLALKEADGEDIQLAFNSRYLLDALNHRPDDQLVHIDFTESIRPFVIRTKGGDTEELDLILPVRMPKEEGEDQTSVIIDDFSDDVQTHIPKGDEE